MTVQAWIILTPQEATDATLLNDQNSSVDPRTIDNPLSNNLGYGALVGKKVVPARLLNDPLYTRWVPTLGGMPIHVMDSDTLFVPSDEPI